MIDGIELIKALVGLAVACWLFFVFRRALGTGMIRFKGREYSRREEPFSFWLLTIMAMVAGLLMAGALIAVFMISW